MCVYIYIHTHESHSLVSDSLKPHGLYSLWNSSRPDYWSGQLFPFPGGLPNLGIKPRSPALQMDFLPAESQFLCILYLYL